MLKAVNSQKQDSNPMLKKPNLNQQQNACYNNDHPIKTKCHIVHISFWLSQMLCSYNKFEFAPSHHLELLRICKKRPNSVDLPATWGGGAGECWAAQVSPKVIFKKIEMKNLFQQNIRWLWKITCVRSIGSLPRTQYISYSSTMLEDKETTWIWNTSLEEIQK